jgi:hypothetical protein
MPLPHPAFFYLIPNVKSSNWQVAVSGANERHHLLDRFNMGLAIALATRARVSLLPLLVILLILQLSCKSLRTTLSTQTPLMQTQLLPPFYPLLLCFTVMNGMKILIPSEPLNLHDTFLNFYDFYLLLFFWLLITVFKSTIILFLRTRDTPPCSYV